MVSLWLMHLDVVRENNARTLSGKVMTFEGMTAFLA